jgi:hypothetical protein
MSRLLHEELLEPGAVAAKSDSGSSECLALAKKQLSAFFATKKKLVRLGRRVRFASQAFID